MTLASDSAASFQDVLIHRDRFDIYAILTDMLKEWSDRSSASAHAYPKNLPSVRVCGDRSVMVTLAQSELGALRPQSSDDSPTSPDLANNDLIGRGSECIALRSPTNGIIQRFQSEE